MPQRPRPVSVGIRHVEWHRVELVASQWVRHVVPLSIWHCDFYLVEADDLRRRNDICRPVPMREPQFDGGIYPLGLVRSSIGSSNLLSMLIDDLL